MHLATSSVLQSFFVYVWMCKYDFNTVRVDADFFKYGEKNFRCRKYPDTCGRGLKLPGCDQIHGSLVDFRDVIERAKGFFAKENISDSRATLICGDILKLKTLHRPNK